MKREKYIELIPKQRFHINLSLNAEINTPVMTKYLKLDDRMTGPTQNKEG